MAYTCAKGGLADASQCMTIPEYFAPIGNLIQNVDDLAAAGHIDPLYNLQGQKAYVFHGTSDYTVFHGNCIIMHVQNAILLTCVHK